MKLLLALVAAACLMAATLMFIIGDAQGAITRAQADGRARVAANDYTSTNFGIGAGAKGWRAACSRSGRHWNCHVTDGGQCVGSLKLTGALKAYAIRIRCAE